MQKQIETKTIQTISNSNPQYMSTIKQKIEYHFFDFFLYILNSQKTNELMDVLCVFIELCQVMTFPLNPRFAPIWKYDSIYLPLSQYFQYFLFIPIFIGSSDIYMIIFYSVFLILLLMSILFIYSTFLVKQQTQNHIFPLKIMSTIISLFGNAIFLPLLETMLSIFYCNDKLMNIYSENMQCWVGTFYVHMSFSIIGIFILVSHFIFYVYICYDIRSLSRVNNSKKTSNPDIILIIVKVYLSIVNATFRGNGFKLVILSISFSFSLYLIYLYWVIKPYHSTIITKLYCISTFILSWGYALLVFGAIFLQSSFDGYLPLLFIGIISILLIIGFIGKRIHFEILFFKIENSNSGVIVKDKILELEDLFEAGHKTRGNKVVLQCYINNYEETCFVSNCFLKQYLNSSDQLFLYLHIESLYQQGISKYPYCISLRLMYVILLYDKLNKIRKAKSELEKISCVPYLDLYSAFAIFYLNNLIEIRLSEKHHQGNIDLSVIRFKILFNAFKTSIIKSASLYLEFWNLLLISRNDIHDDLTKLSNFGSQINAQIKDINLKLDSLQQMKKNDEEIVQLFSEFLGEILNKKKEANEYRKQLVNKRRVIDDDKEDNENFDEEDFISLTSKKDKMFILISAQKESFCTITHISLGISSKLGYSRNELIGHSINMILPEIYRKHHQKMLLNKIENNNISKNNKDGNLSLSSKNKLVKTVALTKSKYILPFSFNCLLTQNENGKHYFIAKITYDANITPTQYDSLGYSLTDDDSCYVLTDKYLRIKNFTSNTIRLLGLSSYEMDGSFELTNYIKEFNEEYFNRIILNKGRDDEHISKRIEMAKDYFKTPIKITWKYLLPSINQRNNRIKIGSIKTSLIDLSQEQPSSITIKTESTFTVTLIEQSINSYTIGFVFKFDICKPIMQSKESNCIISFQFSNNSISKLERKISSNQFGFAAEKKATLMESNQSFGFVDKQLRDLLPKKNKSPNQSTIINNNFKFDKSYIPSTSSPRFILDPINNVFREFHKSKKENEIIRQTLKQKALELLKMEKKIEYSSIHDSSSISYTDDEDSTNKEDTESGNHSVKLKQDDKKNKRVLVPYQENYYQINLTKIKLLIYDYKKHQPVDYYNDKYLKHKSEIEIKLKDYSNDSFLDNITPHVKTPQFNKSFKQVKLGSPSLSSAISHSTLKQITTPTETKQFLIRQIDFSLHKKDTQILIIIFQIITLMSLIILLIEGAILLYICLSNQKTLKELTTLLVYSGEIIFVAVMSVYHARELTLLHNENYTVTMANRQEYIANHTTELYLLFKKYSLMQTYIATSSFSLTDQNYQTLYKKPVNMTIITEGYFSKNFTVSIYTSFVQLQLSLFTVSQIDFILLMPTNREAYFYITNSMNSNLFNQGEQMNVFFTKIYFLFKIAKQSLLIYGIVIASNHFLLGVGMQIIYNKVVLKKTSYLEIFLKINHIIIAKLYDQCDKFLKKMQIKDNSIKENMEDESLGSIQDDYGDDVPSFYQDNYHVVAFNKLRNKSKNKIKNSKTRFLNWLIALVFVGTFSVLFGIAMLYWSFFGKMTSLLQLYKNQLFIQIDSLMAFNVIREYIVDINSKVYNQPVTNYTMYMLSQHMHKLSDSQKQFEDQLDILDPQFQIVNYNLYNKNICYFSTDYFEKNNTASSCDDISNKATSYGLQNVLLLYFEEIRFLKTLNTRNFNNLKSAHFKYNFTLLGTSIAQSYWPQGILQIIYWGMMPSHIFNSKSYLTATFLFRYIIRPGFALLMGNMYKAIQYEALSIEKTLIIIIGCFLAFFFVFYICIWKPFENKLNDDIYKTKNMLTIIPNEVLVTIKNIAVLLELDKNALLNETFDSEL